MTVIATGGLAPLVIDEVKIIEAYEPWLTLIGLRLVWERNQSDRIVPCRNNDGTRAYSTSGSSLCCGGRERIPVAFAGRAT